MNNKINNKIKWGKSIHSIVIFAFVAVVGFALAACEEIVDPAEQTYTVTYSGNTNTGGTAPVDSNSPYQGTSRVTVLGNTGNLVKTGYTFTNWNTQAGGGGTPYNPGDGFDITANVTLYAQWAESPKFTLAYNANSGSGSAPVDSNSPYFSGTLVTVMQKGDLNRNGYYFNGWNTLANGTGTSYAEGATFTIAANTVLYAQWATNLTVTYNVNGGSGTAPVDSNSPYKSGESVTVMDKGSLTRNNYYFTGWNTVGNGSGTAYAEGATFTITASTTLYAQWANNHTVSYIGNGHTSANSTVPTDTVTYAKGASVTTKEKGTLLKRGYDFTNWNTKQDGTGSTIAAGADFTITENITLYAQWELSTMPTGDLAAKLQWLTNNALQGTEYLVEVSKNETIGPYSFDYLNNNTNVKITLRGVGSMREIALNATTGNLFTVASGITLILENNITLTGRYDTQRSLINVNGGTLIMNEGTILKSNGQTYSNSSYGGGVLVQNNGNFTMEGGTITDCLNDSGGGVAVRNNGTFTMNGGTINNCKAFWGGAIRVDAGTFNFNNGQINNNSTVIYTSQISEGGGAVYLGNSSAIFIMEGGTISNNTSHNFGGGVQANSGTFNMRGGVISGNTASEGGGIYVRSATLNKTGGTLYGSGEGENSNTATSVYNSSLSPYYQLPKGNAAMTWDNDKHRNITHGPTSTPRLFMQGGTTEGWDN